MENFQITNEEYIDIKRLLGALQRKLWLILMAGIAMAVVAYAAATFLIAPTYESCTKIYAINSRESSNQLTVNDFAMASYLSSDYAILLKATPIAQEVINELGIDATPEDFLGRVTIEAIDSSRVMSIKIVDEDPIRAKELADAYRDAAIIYLKSVTGAEEVNVVEEASLPVRPSGISTKKLAALGGVVGCFLAMVWIIIKYLMDDAISNPEDVEKYLGANVIGMIPFDTKLEKKSLDKGTNNRRRKGDK